MKKHMNLFSKTICFSLTIATLLLLGGCAGTKYIWYQSGKDTASFKQDHVQCQEESAKYARYMDRRGDREIIYERMKECMGVRGYVRTPEKELPEGAPRFE